MGRSGTRCRSRCSISVALPARHREKAGKLYLPAVQRMGSEQKRPRLVAPLDDSSVAGQEAAGGGRPRHSLPDANATSARACLP